MAENSPISGWLALGKFSKPDSPAAGCGAEF